MPSPPLACKMVELVEDRHAALMLTTCVLMLVGLFLAFDVSCFVTLPG